MEQAAGGTVSFRQRALDQIKQVKWDPAWGEERISNMIATRPDWCISRQRIWGVPIALFLCTKCNQPLHAPEAYAKIVELFEQRGADAWYASEADNVLPAGAKCATPDCGGTGFRRETDILDVWIDSGTSWAAVLETEPELRFPADLYLEGGDQHRGWFHSSLLFSVGLRDTAPYRMVATSGWTLDEQGRAFSKSLGNGVDPVDIAKRLGGEVVRLWVASVDFREDVSASENLMQRVADNYRKLRNTFRFLLGNLYDFDPAQHAVAWELLEPLDQYMLARTRELTTKVLGWYEEFEFHRIYHAVNEFAIVDLSALYADVLKDRLYTFAPNSPQRRAAQTVLWKITDALARLVAPILSFLADEVWEHLPQESGGARESLGMAAEGEATYDRLQNFARVRLRVKPNLPGHGFTFSSELTHDSRYLGAIASGAREASKGGISAGGRIADVCVILLEAEEDPARSSEKAFSIAASQAFKEAARLAGAALQEPLPHPHSVHMTLFPHPDDLAPRYPGSLIADWETLLAIREIAMRSLEQARQDKRIGKALEAKLRLTLPAEQYTMARKYESSLKELLNVSQVELALSDANEPGANTDAADGAKCARCWNYRTDIGADPRWTTVCGRCAGALEEIGFPPLNEEVPA